MRRKSRTDSNQKELVNFAKDHGATVAHLHTLGKGIPDILIGYQGRNYLVEIKSEDGKLTSDEEVFFNNWRGDAAVVATKKDLIRLLDLPMSSLDLI